MKVRSARYAGAWYPADPVRLRHDLDHYLASAPVQVPTGKVWGIVVPHAGYYYAGAVAAHAFNCLSGLHPNLVVVISPLHDHHAAHLLTAAYEAYETPLNTVKVDFRAVRALNQALQKRLGYGLTPLRHDLEHALEIELPFLQHLLDDFQLLPIMIRDQRPVVSQAIGQALGEILQGQQVLFVASSDLSHFYPQDRACELDAEFLRRLAAFDPDGIMAAEEEGVGFACGGAAIAAVLWATQALGANRITVLNHATSGDISGSFSSVVGYGAAVIWQQAQNGDHHV